MNRKPQQFGLSQINQDLEIENYLKTCPREDGDLKLES